MAKRSGRKEGKLSSSPSNFRNLNRGDVSMDCDDGSEDLSLEEILILYSQPINEEQAWAVCYQCCRTLAQKPRRQASSKSAGSSAVDYPRRIEGPGNVRIGRDGAVKLHFGDSTGNQSSPDQKGFRDYFYKANEQKLQAAESQSQFFCE